MSKMTVVITRSVGDRYRGFLASCMLEIAPGVYVHPELNAGVCERIWEVMWSWVEAIETGGGVVMCWPDEEEPSGLAMRFVGWPKKELINHEGTWLAWSALTAEHDVEELLRLQSLEDAMPLTEKERLASELDWLADMLADEEQ